MLDQLALTALHSLPELIVAAVLCLPVIFKKEKKTGLVFVFLASLFLYNIILSIGVLPQPSWLQWNWLGKIFAILFALAVIYLVKQNNNTCYFGLTFKQKAGSLKPVLFVVAVYVILEFIYLIIFRGPGSFSIEAHLYQLTMPGISEEIVYRGLFLGLLNEIFPNKKKIGGAKLGYGALIVSLLFALTHGLHYSGLYNISFNWLPTVLTLYFAIVVVWIRERTGSVLIPILFHNLTNELGYITQILK